MGQISQMDFILRETPEVVPPNPISYRVNIARPIDNLHVGGQPSFCQPRDKPESIENKVAQLNYFKSPQEFKKFQRQHLLLPPQPDLHEVMPERNKGGQFIVGLQQQQYRDGPNGFLPPKRNMSNPADHPYLLDA
jgi:hypothetical protein